MLKKIWNDPVGSKVIASVIIAGTGWLTYRLNWWPGWITRRIAGLWASLWAYMLSSFALPHWLLILLILFALPTIVFGCVFVWITLFPKKDTTPDGATGPHWSSYTTDLFDGLRWRWRYTSEGGIERVLSFCPVCDFQVFPDTTSSFADRISFHCESCGKNLGTLQGPYSYLDSKVTRLIQQKLRTQSWPVAGS